jgi:hypothetical protein
MKVVLTSFLLLSTSLTFANRFASKGFVRQENQAPSTCEEAVSDLARFTEVSSESGTNRGGDPWRSIKHTSTAGESFWEGFNSYKSESRFKKAVLQISENVEGLAGWTPLFDDKGHQIGQRVIKETKADGKVTNVLIRRITNRTIQGISAPSWKLALTAEKATITCAADDHKQAN